MLMEMSKARSCTFKESYGLLHLSAELFRYDEYKPVLSTPPKQLLWLKNEEILFTKLKIKRENGQRYF